VDQAAAGRRVARAPVGRLATVTPGGHPHIVPCCFAVVGERIYSAVDAKPKSTLALARLDNIRAQPAVSLLVDHYEDDWDRLWWVRVDGVAHVEESEARRAEALGALAGKYEQYRESAPPGPVIAVESLRWRWWPRGRAAPPG
jgi:PPOX class probable F420-dependent enzyme